MLAEEEVVDERTGRSGLLRVISLARCDIDLVTAAVSEGGDVGDVGLLCPMGDFFLELTCGSPDPLFFPPFLLCLLLLLWLLGLGEVFGMSIELASSIILFFRFVFRFVLF